MQDTIKLGRFIVDFTPEEFTLFQNKSDLVFMQDYDNDELLDIVKLILKVRIYRDKYAQMFNEDMQYEAEEQARQELADLQKETDGE